VDKQLELEVEVRVESPCRPSEAAGLVLSAHLTQRRGCCQLVWEAELLSSLQLSASEVRRGGTDGEGTWKTAYQRGFTESY